jgi:hypothetical protein
MTHLLENKLLKDSQHGFIPKKSCTTKLLEFLEKVNSAEDWEESMTVIFLDLAKLLSKYQKKEAAGKTRCTWSQRESAQMDTELAHRQKAKSCT